MDKTIENKLFAEFQNGAAAMCLKYIKRVIVRKNEKLDEWESKYYSAFPAEVAKRTDSFDDIAWPINIVGEYRIAQEISDNLDNLSNDSVIERYIISILEVFEDWANIFTPIATLRMLNDMMENAHDDKEIYTPDEIQQEIERVSKLHDDYLEIMHGAENGSMEWYFKKWYKAYYKFCIMFSAICVEHNINLLEIQAKRGIWIIEKLDVSEIQNYFGYNGDFTYANSLLKSLPRTCATEYLINTERCGKIDSETEWNKDSSTSTANASQCDMIALSKELATDKAIRYFKIAIEHGFIEQTKTGFHWTLSNTLLAFFCGVIYCEDEVCSDGWHTPKWKFGTNYMPDVQLQALFNIPNIAQLRSNKIDNSRQRIGRLPLNWKKVWQIFK